jgi:hypothetical protein
VHNWQCLPEPTAAWITLNAVTHAYQGQQADTKLNYKNMNYAYTHPYHWAAFTTLNASATLGMVVQVDQLITIDQVQYWNKLLKLHLSRKWKLIHIRLSSTIFL